VSTIDKGTRWAAAVGRWLEERGAVVTRSRWMDRGDDIRAELRSLLLSVECKNHGKLTLAAAVDQAEANAGADALGLVVSHRAGHAAVDAAYVVMTGATFARLLGHLR